MKLAKIKMTGIIPSLLCSLVGAALCCVGAFQQQGRGERSQPNTEKKPAPQCVRCETSDSSAFSKTRSRQHCLQDESLSSSGSTKAQMIWLNPPESPLTVSFKQHLGIKPFVKLSKSGRRLSCFGFHFWPKKTKIFPRLLLFLNFLIMIHRLSRLFSCV